MSQLNVTEIMRFLPHITLEPAIFCEINLDVWPSSHVCLEQGGHTARIFFKKRKEKKSSSKSNLTAWLLCKEEGVLKSAARSTGPGLTE